MAALVAGLTVVFIFGVVPFEAVTAGISFVVALADPLD
jgi:hypothetical protein